MLVVFAYAGLIFAYGLPDLPDSSALGLWAEWFAFAARTFTFHAGLLFLLASLWMVSARLWRPVLAGVPVLAFTLLPTVALFVPRSHRELQPDTLGVMSINLLVGSGSAALAVSEIQRLNPDVVLIQEYSGAAHEVMEPALRVNYPHIITSSRDDAFGQAVYSKRAPVEPPLLFPPASLGAGGRTGGPVNLRDPQIRVVVNVAGRDVVLQNVHTVPPISPAFVAEQSQLIDWLGGYAETEKRPVIMGGDFNATDESLGRLRRAGLANAHDHAGFGRACTWHDVGWMNYMPSVRIDHVYVSRDLACDRWERANSIGSDHRPIFARIGFPATR